jgi:hypothetical protein
MSPQKPKRFPPGHLTPRNAGEAPDQPVGAHTVSALVVLVVNDHVLKGCSGEVTATASDMTSWSLANR